MPLTLVKRGARWHLKGTVRLGCRIVRVRETTGTDRRELAEQVRIRREAELLEWLHRPEGGHAVPSFTLAVDRYTASRPQLHRNDLKQLQSLLTAFGPITCDRVPDAWSGFASSRLAGLADDTVNRWRSTLMAVLNDAGAGQTFTALKVPRRRAEPPPPHWLSLKEQKKLLESYAVHVRPLAVFLCFSGARIGEALRLRLADVNWERGQITLRHTKSRAPRYVPMHVRVRAELEAMQLQHGCAWQPARGHVFLNRLGQPYRDHRVTGGTPIAKAHATACKKAGIEDFTVHDWRHHFASWFLMKGGHTEALKKICGWRDDRMVRRYAHLTDDFLAREIERL